MADTQRFRQLLGLRPGANATQIRRAFRKAVLKYHPDHYRGDKKEGERIFREVREAYEALLEEAIRAETATPEPPAAAGQPGQGESATSPADRPAREPKGKGLSAEQLARETMRRGRAGEAPAAADEQPAGPPRWRKMAMWIGIPVVLVAAVACVAVAIWNTPPKPPEELKLDLGGGVSMRLVEVPAGKFTMGAALNDPDRQPNEMPTHEVTISRAFFMGAYEVTQQQYKQVMGENPSKFQRPDGPVDRVTWGDTVEFCKKMSAAVGRTVRLPTEAEWEYACRAGSRERFCFGDDAEKLGEYAWFGAPDGATHPVGQKKANRFGLYDMHGNVWEWCQDRYEPNYYANGPNVDPQGPETAENRVVRGGACQNTAKFCRSAYRRDYAAYEKLDIYGFRVVVVAAGGGSTVPGSR
jgi:formylglycine-generating enzyme required for sulfatase activity